MRCRKPAWSMDSGSSMHPKSPMMTRYHAMCTHFSPSPQDPLFPASNPLSTFLLHLRFSYLLTHRTAVNEASYSLAATHAAFTDRMSCDCVYCLVSSHRSSPLISHSSGARCRFAYGPADATATYYLLLVLPLATISPG